MKWNIHCLPTESPMGIQLYGQITTCSYTSQVYSHFIVKNVLLTSYREVYKRWQIKKSGVEQESFKELIFGTISVDSVNTIIIYYYAGRLYTFLTIYTMSFKVNFFCKHEYTELQGLDKCKNKSMLSVSHQSEYGRMTLHVASNADRVT